MATRTISNAGGNYNAVGTWVEGIVPTSADDVVATATSGQLTVNVASAARSFNFTNYTNTLTMGTTWTASGVATQTFVSGMTISGTGLIILNAAAATITTNGKTIPNLQITNSKTLTDTLNVVNITTTNTVTFTTGTINCSGNFTASVSQVNGTSPINLIGTGTITLPNYGGTGGIILNTSGTLSGSTAGIGLSNNCVLTYSAGTLNQMRLKNIGTPITINGNGVEFESYDDFGGNAGWPNTINIPTEFKVKYFNIDTNLTTANPNSVGMTIDGAGALNVTQSMNLNSGLVSNGGVIQYKPPGIAFQTGVTHTINSLIINGYNSITTNTTLSNSKAQFKSSTPGVRADINLVNPTQSIIANTDITDINFTGAPVYTLLSGGTINNSLNVTNTSIGATTGATATTAFTFVN